MTVGTAGYSRPLTASGVDITCDITGIHLEGGVRRAEAIAGIAFCTRGVVPALEDNVEPIKLRRTLLPF